MVVPAGKWLTHSDRNFCNHYDIDLLVTVKNMIDSDKCWYLKDMLHQ